jgi:hypothetical protein
MLRRSHSSTPQTELPFPSVENMFFYPYTEPGDENSSPALREYGFEGAAYSIAVSQVVRLKRPGIPEAKHRLRGVAHLSARLSTLLPLDGSAVYDTTGGTSLWSKLGIDAIAILATAYGARKQLGYEREARMLRERKDARAERLTLDERWVNVPSPSSGLLSETLHLDASSRRDAVSVPTRDFLAQLLETQESGTDVDTAYRAVTLHPPGIVSRTFQGLDRELRGAYAARVHDVLETQQLNTVQHDASTAFQEYVKSGFSVQAAAPRGPTGRLDFSIVSLN